MHHPVHACLALLHDLGPERGRCHPLCEHLTAQRAGQGATAQADDGDMPPRL
jgi:hypothetical protein